jgi:colicin import membrane protein
MQDTQLPGARRDDLLPRAPEGMGRGLLFALGAHALLVAALTFSVNWNSSDPAGIEAELWAAVPQIAAQKIEAVEPEPAPVPPKPAPEPEPPPPPPKPVEAPPPQPPPAPQIAIEKEKEKARKEKQLKEEQLREKREKEKEKEKEKERQEKLAEEKREKEEQLREKQLLAEKKKQDAARQAKLDAQRDAQLKRILAQAGAENGSPGGRAAQTAGPSSTYGGRIRAAVEPNITLTTELNGNPTAEVEVRQAPDGTITGRKLVKSSGVREWDDAVLRAIDKTERLPRDIDGRVISPVIITFRPNK